MFKLLIILLISVTFGHQNKLQSDADLQSELMPQDLNPTFVSAKDEPWKAVMPTRPRRESIQNIMETSSTIATIKFYSRIVSCVVLALSAIIEISVYVAEMYNT